jgi:hypothetical protein
MFNNELRELERAEQTATKRAQSRRHAPERLLAPAPDCDPLEHAPAPPRRGAGGCPRGGQHWWAPFSALFFNLQLDDWWLKAMLFAMVLMFLTPPPSPSSRSRPSRTLVPQAD